MSFFFQAEDGIRDTSVTGVQTCALPICIKPIRRDAEHIVALDADAVDDRTDDGAGLDWFVQATRRRGDGFLWDALSRHEPILARRGLPSDRKSTRLNSSHRCISYAVFCLKKKKNTK